MSTVVQIEANSTATQGKTRSTYLSQAVLLHGCYLKTHG